MSLINRMLQDLDERQAVGRNQEGLLERVRALPPGRSAVWSRTRLLILLGTLALGGSGFIYFEWRQHDASVLQSPEEAAEMLSSGSLQDLAGTGLKLDPLGPPPTAGLPVQEVQVPSVATVVAETGGASPLLSEEVVNAVPAPIASKPEAPSSGPGMPASSGKIEKTSRPPTPGERAEYAYRRAQESLGRGQVVEAQGDLRQALQDDPSHLAARQSLVKLLLDQRATDQAMGVLREGIHINVRQSQWAMLLARLELEQGDAGRAWSTLERGLPAATGDPEYLAFAGVLLRQLGQGELAAEYYRRALALVPGEGRWWLGLGMALESSGHDPEARQAYQRALQTGSLTADLKSFAEKKLH